MLQEGKVAKRCGTVTTVDIGGVTPSPVTIAKLGIFH